ncbi:pre-mRNA-splicing factor CWC26 [Coprinopsis marcescibilis]|uniref:Pre-mRNA-splicing factor CWC26 n=1 Tax=Coprinopsis marcescibilis TaxID=230819 RepID=A0A5C3L476_COPMA|nr:pre-mRNA-splicing factor CWC26 [Coprinopsis marcescibilis]
MSNLKAYLAEKYMSGTKADVILAKTAPQKKKKRKKEKDSSTTSGARIVDDDGGWPDEGKDEVDDDMADAVVASDRGFKKRKVGTGEPTWVTVQEGSAIQEEEATPADEEPMVVDAPFAGGLVSAKDLKKVLPQNAVTKKNDYTAEEIARAQETVYRDASGKKIDTKAAKAEAARLKREKEEQEARKMEWGKGVVQRDEADKRRQELEKNKSRPFARGIDDKDLNDELKEKAVWNDPAAAFLSKKKSKGPRKPEYVGPTPPPNRFGIKPGYRWDGVDRSNGFEKKFFQAQNSRKRRGAESHQWSVEDM